MDMYDSKSIFGHLKLAKLVPKFTGNTANLNQESACSLFKIKQVIAEILVPFSISIILITN